MKNNRIILWITIFTLIVVSACKAASPISTQTTVASNSPGVSSSTTNAPATITPESPQTPTQTPLTTAPLAGQAELITKWRAPVGLYVLLTAVCETTEESLNKQLENGATSIDSTGEVFGIRLFMGMLDQAISDWTPEPGAEKTKQAIQKHIDAISGIADRWSDGSLKNENVLEEINAACTDAEAGFKEMMEVAKKEGLTDESLTKIIEDIQKSVAVTSTPSLDEKSIEIPKEVGFSRSNPFPFGEISQVPNWNIRVVESIRGQEAWKLIQTANQYNEPPLEGMEYVLIKVHVVCQYKDQDEHSISSIDFNLTGSHLIQYTSASVVSPEPGLNASLFDGGETEGWLSFMVGVDEANLILIFDEMSNWDSNRYRFLAVDDGAKIEISEDLRLILPTDLGVDRNTPAGFGDIAVTKNWEVQLLDVLLGDEAWSKITKANQFNDPPPDGMQYILAKVKVRYIGVENTAQNINGISFKSTGSKNILYDPPSVVSPEPGLNFDLFPGGSCEGWVVLTAAVDETNLTLVFQPFSDWDDTNRRYLSLESK